jgi:Mn2+/Fe2+ NRAMP family transporter
MDRKRFRLLKLLGPGILVAATGVGAGDLATGALTGARLGVAVLWAVLLGAFLKFVLNEGLARWQLATGETLLEGTLRRYGRLAAFVFLVYLLVWSLAVGSALMSASGVAFHAIWPVFEDARTAKIVFGLLHSAAALALIRLGGYRLFERVMSACIAVMFATVVTSAVAVQPDWSAVARGLVVPSIPSADGEGVRWTVGLMGGIGGTLTVLCYGYWIREEGRTGGEDVATCRIDLAAGYLMTAVFGLAMVTLGSRIQAEGEGTLLVVNLAKELERSLGPFGPYARWAFLIGGWGAIFSSVLGVWQSVPYLFADFVRLRAAIGRDDPTDVPKADSNAPPVALTNTPAYRWYQYALATVPAIGLLVPFATVQLIYAVIGATFIPLLALVLLALNRRRYVGEEFRNRPATDAVLIFSLLFFLAAGALEVMAELNER